MNAGFSNLVVLKKTLLAASQATDSRFDDAIKYLGLGLAARIENLCNRKLMRLVDYQEIQPADRADFPLSRYPIEGIPVIELKLTETDGFILQDATFYNTVDLANGIVMGPDNVDAGPYYAQVRFTYTGGFWWDTGPNEDGSECVMPAGANPLPDDLRAAWLLQCQDTWSRRDKLGLGIMDKPQEQSALGDLKMSPEVKEMIRPFIRYRMV